MKRLGFFIFCLAFVFFIDKCPAETIILGIDSNYWYPYIFTKNDKPAGIHIDIVKRALKYTGHTPIFKILPWNRCLKGAKTGNINSVVSASYKNERAEYMIYPVDAQYTIKSKWRITQVSYIVVTRNDNSYIFEGDLATIPEPVLIPLGYSIVDDLKALGINIKTEYNILDCIWTMDRMQKGSVILPPRNAVNINKTRSMDEKLTIHSKPIKSKSYFLTFSKKNPILSMEDIHRIWNEIEKIRNNETYMNQLSNKYE